MTLSDNLLHLDMTFVCPGCGLPIIKTGQQFKTASEVLCDSCGLTTLLGFPAKVLLFKQYQSRDDDL